MSEDYELYVIPESNHNKIETCTYIVCNPLYEQLSYKLAKHINNTSIPLERWQSEACQLLIELRNLNPQKYDDVMSSEN